MRMEVGITAKTGLVVHCRLIGSWPTWVMQAPQTLHDGYIVPLRAQLPATNISRCDGSRAVRTGHARPFRTP